MSGVKTRDKSNNTKDFRIADLSPVFPTSIRRMKNKSWVKFSHKNCAEPYDLSGVKTRDKYFSMKYIILTDLSRGFPTTVSTVQRMLDGIYSYEKHKK